MDVSQQIPPLLELVHPIINVLLLFARSPYQVSIQFQYLCTKDLFENKTEICAQIQGLSSIIKGIQAHKISLDSESDSEFVQDQSPSIAKFLQKFTLEIQGQLQAISSSLWNALHSILTQSNGELELLEEIMSFISTNVTTNIPLFLFTPDFAYILLFNSFRTTKNSLVLSCMTTCIHTQHFSSNSKVVEMIHDTLQIMKVFVGDSKFIHDSPDTIACYFGLLNGVLKLIFIFNLIH